MIIKKLRTIAMLAALGSFSASAVTVLTFEGLQNLEPVANYYNGGFGGNGSGPGPAYGVTFSGATLAIIDADAGGTGNIGGEPSPSTAMFFLDAQNAVMNYAAGFDTGFSFYYTAINSPGSVTVWSGLNATGTLLATIQLPVTPSDGGDPNGAFSPFYPVGVTFAGTAQSIDFGGTANQIAFDNITFGSETPVGVPDGGASALMLGLGLLGLGVLRRIKK